MNQEALKETAGDIATRLAHERTDAAMTRTRMAAERTLMAWIRTSLSMISFGFTILKFFEFLHEAQGPLGKFHGERARHLGGWFRPFCFCEQHFQIVLLRKAV